MDANTNTAQYAHLFCNDSCAAEWRTDMSKEYASEMVAMLSEVDADRKVYPGTEHCLQCGAELVAPLGEGSRYLLAHPDTSDRYYGFGWRVIERTERATVVGGPADSCTWQLQRLQSGIRALGFEVYTSAEAAKAGIVNW